MKRRVAVAGALISPLLVRAQSQDSSQLVEIPLRFATLSADPPQDPQVGIVIQDLEQANQQVSTVLLQGLQNLGLLIESPKLDASDFLKPKVEWKSSQRELDQGWIREHNNFAGASVLPTGRIYAVQYLGKYDYAPNRLQIALTILLFERSSMGPYRPAASPFSSLFFSTRLEQSIKALLKSEAKR